jgi:hypothetical protein
MVREFIILSSMILSARVGGKGAEGETQKIMMAATRSFSERPRDKKRSGCLGLGQFVLPALSNLRLARCLLVKSCLKQPVCSVRGGMCQPGENVANERSLFGKRNKNRGKARAWAEPPAPINTLLQPGDCGRPTEWNRFNAFTRVPNSGVDCCIVAVFRMRNAAATVAIPVALCSRRRREFRQESSG